MMARPVEKETVSSNTLTPQEVQQQSTAFANIANAQSQVDAAQAKVNKNPTSAIAKQQLDSAQAALNVAKAAYDVTKLPAGAMAAGSTKSGTTIGGPSKTAIGTYADPQSGDIYIVFDDGSRTLSARGGITPGQQARQSAYDLLFQQFNQYGLGSLVEPLKDLIQSNVSPAEFSLRLQNTDAYKKRFAANQDRIKAGLTALSPAEYIGLEDQYQNIMRNYGLPASYYATDAMGTQEGFKKLIASDVSAAELEDRIATAQNRVLNANPEVKTALKQFYPDITDGDILAYTLDPTKALTDIKRKVTAAEIGGAALGQGLKTAATTAEQLAQYGVTKQQAQQGYQAIAEFLPTGEKLSQIYGESPYTQQQAEQEVFNLADAAAAAKKRRRLTQLEQAAFSGSSGISGGALSRDRAVGGQGAYGAGQY